MVNGIINTVVKDLFIDTVVMPFVILKVPFLGAPIVRNIVRWFVAEVLFDEFFDESQRFVNFKKIFYEEQEKNENYKPARDALQKFEEEGADLETNEEALRAYEEFKKRARDLIVARDAGVSNRPR